MTNDLRNRVARALCWANGMDPDLTLGGDGENFLWHEYVHQADAALAEIGAVQNQLDEAINQLDSARHSVEVLERRLAEMQRNTLLEGRDDA